MRELPDELLKKPFTPALAAAYDVTPRQLQGARVRQLLYGVHIGAEIDVTLEVLAEAVGLILPAGAVISGSTAALFHGADVRRPGDTAIDVTMLRRSEIRRRGIRATAAYLEPGDVVEWAGVPITSPVRTAFDLARRKELIERVVGVDAMLNRGGCDRAQLAEYIDDHASWRGIRWARQALTYAEPMSESPMETRQRMRFVLAGLPRPEAQYTLYDRNGVFVARLDHAFTRWRVAPEYDGEDHAQTWRRDNERHQRIENEGWWHRGYNSLSIRNRWDQMIDEVARVLVDRGWRPNGSPKPQQSTVLRTRNG